ncbi:MAG TPA: RNA polymerase sigma factor [Fimbriimonadaceae bacterium]|nr:RNA polymerase sigma factor [Fimbriimonadaceae bacterium]
MLTIRGISTENEPELPCRDRLESLISKHRPLIKKLCAGYCPQREDAEDLEAMTLLTACRRFETFDPTRGKFGTWVGAIVRTEASDMRRQRLREPACLPNDAKTEWMLEQHPAPFVDPISNEPGEAGLGLTPLLRRAFTLVKLDGLTYVEAARVMGRTEGTIRTYVWRARQVLRGSAPARTRWALPAPTPDL